MKYSILVSVVVVIGFVGKVYTYAICSGIDVTNDPRITGKMVCLGLLKHCFKR